MAIYSPYSVAPRLCLTSPGGSIKDLLAKHEGGYHCESRTNKKRIDSVKTTYTGSETEDEDSVEAAFARLGLSWPHEETEGKIKTAYADFKLDHSGEKNEGIVKTAYAAFKTETAGRIRTALASFKSHQLIPPRRKMGLEMRSCSNPSRRKKTRQGKPLQVLPMIMEEDEGQQNFSRKLTQAAAVVRRESVSDLRGPLNSHPPLPPLPTEFKPKKQTNLRGPLNSHPLPPLPTESQHKKQMKFTRTKEAKERARLHKRISRSSVHSIPEPCALTKVLAASMDSQQAVEWARRSSQPLPPPSSSIQPISPILEPVPAEKRPHKSALASPRLTYIPQDKVKKEVSFPTFSQRVDGAGKIFPKEPYPGRGRIVVTAVIIPPLKEMMEKMTVLRSVRRMARFGRD